MPSVSIPPHLEATLNASSGASCQRSGRTMHQWETDLAEGFPRTWEGNLHIAHRTGETRANPVLLPNSNPTPSRFLPLPPASPLSFLCRTLAMASPKPLCDPRAISFLPAVCGPHLPQHKCNSVVLEACASEGLPHILPQSPVAYQRVLLFTVEFFKNSLNQAGLVGEAEGEAGKSCCTENKRFSKDTEKAGVFVPTSPLS